MVITALGYLSKPEDQHVPDPSVYFSTPLILSDNKPEEYNLTLYLGVPQEIRDTMMIRYFRFLFGQHEYFSPAHVLKEHFNNIEHGYLFYPVDEGQKLDTAKIPIFQQVVTYPLSEDPENFPSVTIGNRLKRNDQLQNNIMLKSLAEFSAKNPFKTLEKSKKQLGIFVLYVDIPPNVNPETSTHISTFATALDEAGWALLIIATEDVADQYVSLVAQFPMRQRLVIPYTDVHTQYIYDAATKFIKAKDVLHVNHWVTTILPHYIEKDVPRRINHHIDQFTQLPVAITFASVQNISPSFKNVCYELADLKHLSGVIETLLHRYGDISFGDIAGSYFHPYYSRFKSTTPPLNSFLFKSAPLFELAQTTTEPYLNLDFASFHPYIDGRTFLHFDRKKKQEDVIHVLVIFGTNPSHMKDTEFYTILEKHRIAVIWVEALPRSELQFRGQQKIDTTEKMFNFPARYITMTSKDFVPSLVREMISLIDELMLVRDRPSIQSVYHQIPEAPVEAETPIDVLLLVPSGSTFETSLQIFQNINNGLNNFREGVNLHITKNVQFGLATFYPSTYSIKNEITDYCKVKLPIHAMNYDTPSLSAFEGFIFEENKYYDTYPAFNSIIQCLTFPETVKDLGWRSNSTKKFIVVLYDQVPVQIPFYNQVGVTKYRDLGNAFRTLPILEKNNAHVIILTYMDFIPIWKDILNTHKIKNNEYTLVPIAKNSNIGIAAGAAIKGLSQSNSSL